jgi:hypothetical protein
MNAISKHRIVEEAIEYGAFEPAQLKVIQNRTPQSESAAHKCSGRAVEFYLVEGRGEHSLPSCQPMMRDPHTVDLHHSTACQACRADIVPRDY